MRRWLIGSTMLVACAQGNSLETTGAYTTLAPTDDDDSAASTGSTSGGSAATTGDGGDDPEPMTSSSSGEGEESSSGGPVLPPQPEASWWSHCITNDDCTDDLVCLTADNGSDGVCTYLCEPAGDATSCGTMPGITATATCLNVGNNSVCALGCAGGATCPAQMVCVSDVDDDGPISFCV